MSRAVRNGAVFTRHAIFALMSPKIRQKASIATSEAKKQEQVPDISSLRKTILSSIGEVRRLVRAHVDPKSHFSKKIHEQLEGCDKYLSETFTLYERQTREIVETLAHLREITTTDELTEAINRRGFTHIYNHLFDRAIAKGGTYKNNPFSLIALDLDGFKQINDTLGHPVGDDTLKTISTCAQAILRPTDTFARMGGDEFSIILPGTNERIAKRVAERILFTLKVTVCEVLKKKYKNFPGVAASIGVISFDNAHKAHPDLTREHLLEILDNLVYCAKEKKGSVYDCEGNVVTYGEQKDCV